jgi:hypothetical protein
MQKSTVNGSQGGSGTFVADTMEEVIDGMGVGRGRDVFVGTTFVLTTDRTGVGGNSVVVGGICVTTIAGVSFDPVFVQETSVRSIKRFKIRFIAYALESASLLAMFWSLSAGRRICKAVHFEQDLKYTMFMDGIYKTYLHNPPHYFVPNAMYIVTGAILHNQHLLMENRRKEYVLQTLFERAKLLNWTLQAWAVLNNHYHFIGQAQKTQ